MNPEPETPPIELSDEMLEAIRILRSDGHTQALNDLKESHAAILVRLDKQDAPKEKDTPDPEKDPRTPSNPVSVPNPVPDAPQPPPRIEPPIDEPPKKGRIPWWERDTYKHD
jgi:hypothetical protein